VCHREKIAEEFGIELVKADKDGVVVLVVGRSVVERWRLDNHGRAVAAVHSDKNRAGFSGFVRGDTGHEIAANLKGGASPRGALLNARKG
jgi:hypothetical protein